MATAGIGKSNAAIGTQLMLDHFHIDRLIHTGIAGSLSADVKCLALILAEQVTYHDVRPRQMINFYPHQASFASDPHLLAAAEQIAKARQLDYHRGLTVTGDDFIDSPEKKARILKDYPALAVDMESASVANAAYINAIPFLVIRSISDLADDPSGMTYREFEQKAADQAAQLVQELVAALEN